MIKKLGIVSLVLLIVFSLSVPMIAHSNAQSLSTMGELQAELQNYFEAHDIVLQPGTPEYLHFITQQAIEGTDAELSALPNYPLLHAYMAHYIVCAEESTYGLHLLKTADGINQESFCNQEDFLNTSIDDIKQDVLKREAVIEQTSNMPAMFASYSGTAAASYAKTHSTAYNEMYPSFALSGGDCTNFVSQCVKAGGKAFTGNTTTSGTVQSTSNWYCVVIDDEWHGNYQYRTWGYTTSWIRVKDFRTFWAGRAAESGYSSSVSTTINNVKLGSVVQLVSPSSGEIYHSIIISEKSGNTAKYCGHSTNRNNYDFNATTMSGANGFYYYNF